MIAVAAVRCAWPCPRAPYLGVAGVAVAVTVAVAVVGSLRVRFLKPAPRPPAALRGVLVLVPVPVPVPGPVPELGRGPGPETGPTRLRLGCCCCWRCCWSSPRSRSMSRLLRLSRPRSISTGNWSGIGRRSRRESGGRPWFAPGLPGRALVASTVAAAVAAAEGCRTDSECVCAIAVETGCSSGVLSGSVTFVAPRVRAMSSRRTSIGAMYAVRLFSDQARTCPQTRPVAMSKTQAPESPGTEGSK